MHRAAAVRRTALSAAMRRQCAARPPSKWVRHASSGSPGAKSSSGSWGVGLVPVLLVSGGLGWYLYPDQDGAKDSVSQEKAAAAAQQLEKRKVREATPVQEDRALLGAQHAQIEKSWETPGVYAWGSNVGRVVAPHSSESVVKTPRRIPFFDGKLLRDLKLDRNFGVAVTEEGDVVQWGTAFAPDTKEPVKTLAGKDIAKVAISSDRIIALSRGGTVFSFPVARSDQQGAGNKSPSPSSSTSSSSSWFPFWSGGSSDDISYRVLTPPSLGWRETVVDISSGLDHCLLLTSSGRVFSAAASTSDFPSKGQLGIPGLTWLTKPKGPYDQPHLIKGLPPIKQVATGNHHSLALDSKNSQVHAWGDNSAGQLGFEVDPKNPGISAPTALPLEKLYGATGSAPSIRSIAAGGSNSYFTVDSSKPAAEDTWACGEGLVGSLGIGKWVHLTSVPAKIKALSGLSEYSDAAQRTVPLRVRSLSVGSTHAAAVLDNATSLKARSSSKTDTPTSWGSDVVWWGGNEFYQLGTGRRSNLNEPTHIAPLDVGGGSGSGRAAAAAGGGAGRFQLTPRATVRIGKDGSGRKVSLEQRIECGRFATAVYSAAV